jgi:hypothetical protein
VNLPKEHLSIMSTLTIEQAVARHGVDVLDHLDRTATIPVLAGLQMQGDLAIVPAAGVATTPVPPAGVPVVRGENGGNTHTLLADGPGVCWDERTATTSSLTLGLLTVPDGSTAYLAHPEHAYSGIAPGTYEIRRQREMADELRMVAD